MVEMIETDSKALKAYGYDPSAQELTVIFRKGGAGQYTYVGVPPDEWERFLAAESKGSYMFHIKESYSVKR